MRYIEAPQHYEPLPGDGIRVFLAGGITNCPDWQAEVIAALERLPLVILNPRRGNFPIQDPGVAVTQIGWEYTHLQIADIILFWFPSTSLCPIALFELGAASRTNKPLLVGTDANYLRRRDIKVQMMLARPDVAPVHSTLEALIAQLILFVHAVPAAKEHPYDP